MKNAVMLGTVYTHTINLINKNESIKNALFVLYKKTGDLYYLSFWRAK